jgi:steroid delta-isomerase-like uncharacterized protein
MTAAELRTPVQVARAAFDAVGRGDPDAIVELGEVDYIDDFVALGLFRGRDTIRDFFRELFTAFPDFEMTADRIICDDGSAVVQWHASGTFSGGSFQGIGPTGRSVELRGVDVMDIADGLIRHNTVYYDGASFARQIGLLPAHGSQADRSLISVFNAVSRLRRRR